MRHLYAIRDKAAEDLAGHNPVVAVRSEAVAIRFFHDTATARQSPVGEHPDDYELLYLGALDDNGTITPSENGPRVVLTGSAWAKINQQPETH